MAKINKNKIDNSLKQGGFTLVEVVLVMVVTGIVFVSIYGLYAHTVKQDMETRFEVMASNLAQEGIEIVRNSRDRALLRDHEIDYYLSAGNCQPWFNGDEASCDGTKIPEIGYDGNKFANCNFGGCAGGTETPFRRICDVACEGTCNAAADPGCDSSPYVADGDCIRMAITCTVSWDSFINPTLTRDITARSVMTSWQIE